MRATAVHVWKVGVGGGVVVVGGEGAALTAETEEGRGVREGGVSLESKGRGEEIGAGKVGRSEGVREAYACRRLKQGRDGVVGGEELQG